MKCNVIGALDPSVADYRAASPFEWGGDAKSNSNLSDRHAAEARRHDCQIALQ